MFDLSSCLVSFGFSISSQCRVPFCTPTSSRAKIVRITIFAFSLIPVSVLSVGVVEASTGKRKSSYCVVLSLENLPNHLGKSL